MIVDEVDERFYVADSGIPNSGNGLFAKVPLAAGDRFEVIGVLVRRDSETDRCTHFADEHKFRVGDDLLLIPMGYGGMANHSATPNMEKVFEGDRVFLRMLRAIEPGEELFFFYHPYAQDRFGFH
jgi:hypothetical protein